MIETTTLAVAVVAVIVAGIVLLMVPLIYLCVLSASEVRYRRLVGLMRVLKRTAPRKRRQLPTRRARRDELDTDA